MIREILAALSVVLPSFAKCMIYRLIGYTIGKNSRIAIFSYVCADEIEIGNDVEIRPFVFVRVKKLSIGDDSIISFGTQIKGEKAFLGKGNNFVGAHCLINCEEDVRIGFYSGLGPRCNVYTHGSFLPVIKGYPAKFETVVLEDYVWVGMAVTILPGTYIESNCIINPGVVVKSRIKANTLMEVSPTAVRAMDLRRLQKLLQNKNGGEFLEEIIRGFLSNCRMDYSYNEKDRIFSASDTYVFKCFPESDIIELSYRGSPAIRYNLATYSADYSKLPIHRKFLFYLRRRYGLILTTKY